ncbi:LCP family protein [Megamonas hypermegale]|uniref:LCP family glycopolymer transferase n=1 Tax=Megamonas hypermegale TaxID=158847 RepID=UPI0019589649|nr:LCP family protein [Megamonas hypermegale]
MYRREDVKKKKKTSYWKYLLILILVFVLSGIGGAYFANALVDNKPMYSDAEKDGLLVAKDKATVMIMGVDKRNDDVGRSDTLMVATLDPDKNQAALLSIPRDTRVKIKGHGYDKINAAYAYGDRKLSQQTVESLLGIKIDHYIVIDVHGFTKIIDALGGIDIDVEKRMYYEDPWDDDGGLYIDLQPGMQHMDGKTAVTYVRYRDEEGDIGRIRRQQKFMKAVMDKLVSPTIIPRLPSIVSAMYDAVETDMSISELLSFLGTLQEAKNNGLKSEMLPGKPVYIDEISYWIPDISKIRQILANTLGIKMNNALTNSIEDDEQEYRESMPKNAVEIPESQHIKNEIERERNERRQNMSQEREDAQRYRARQATEDYEEGYNRRTQELRETENSESTQTTAPKSTDRQTQSDTPAKNAETPDMNNHSEGKN